MTKQRSFKHRVRARMAKTGGRHPEIVRWLSTEHGVPDWYTQAITVTYERARGLRVVGQRADGSFVASATKTIAVPIERLFDAFQDQGLRDRWLPGAELRLRAATAPRTARYDWEDGESRVVVAFVEVSDAKSQVALEHERLHDADTVGEMKTWWRARLAELKTQLEGGRTR
jgi:hypothetical protein